MAETVITAADTSTGEAVVTAETPEAKAAALAATAAAETPEAKAAAAAAAETPEAKAAALAIETAKQTDALLDPDLKSTDATVKAAAEKLKADLASTDPKVKADAEKQLADRKAAKEAADKKLKGDGAPEKYEDFKLPEGAPEGMTIDKALLDKALPIFKEDNLSQAQAQRYVNMYASQRIEDAKLYVKQSEETWQETRAKWVETAKADKEIGGAKWDESVGIAKRFINNIAKDRPGLKTALELTGAGDHPDVIYTFATMGRLGAEHKLVFGGGASEGAPKDAAKTLFPNQN